MLNLEHLKKQFEESEQKKNKVYDELYKLVNNAIKFAWTHNKSDCTYKLSPFIPGLPIYNINEARQYIVKKLQNNGFNVYTESIDVISVHWDINKPFKSQENEINKKEKDIETEEINEMSLEDSLIKSRYG